MIFCQTFLAVLLENEQFYLQGMSTIAIGESLCFDHTFKVATNIGYLQEDRKRITEFNGLLLVLNIMVVILLKLLNHFYCWFSTKQNIN